MKLHASEAAIVATLGALLPLVAGCEEEAVKYVEVPYPSSSSLASDSRSHAPIASASASGEARPSPTPIAGVALVPTAKPSALWPPSFNPETHRTLAAVSPPASPHPAATPKISSAPAAAVAVAKPRCDPPYYYDASGARVFKETCL